MTRTVGSDQALEVPLQLSGVGRADRHANTTLTCASEAFLHNLSDVVRRWFRMWEPCSGVHTFNAGKAIAAGLRHRPCRPTPLRGMPIVVGRIFASGPVRRRRPSSWLPGTLRPIRHDHDG